MHTRAHTLSCEYKLTRVHTCAHSRECTSMGTLRVHTHAHSSHPLQEVPAHPGVVLPLTGHVQSRPAPLVGDRRVPTVVGAGGACFIVELQTRRQQVQLCARRGVRSRCPSLSPKCPETCHLPEQARSPAAQVLPTDRPAWRGERLPPAPRSEAALVKAPPPSVPWAA